MTVYAITDTKKGEQGLRLLIFKLPLKIILRQSLKILCKSGTGSRFTKNLMTIRITKKNLTINLRQSYDRTYNNLKTKNKVFLR